MDCNFIGKFAYYFFPYRKKVIKKNIKIVFKDTLSTKETKKFIQDVYAHYIRAVIMIFRTHFFYKNAIKSSVNVISQDYFIKAHSQKNGVILLCCHMGYFQWGLIKTVNNFKALDKFSVVLKPIRVQWLEKIFYSGIKSSGAEIVSAKNGFRKIFSALKKGGVVFFPFDQHAKINNKEGVIVDFFGQNTGTYSSLAMLVKRTQAKVVPVFCYFSKELNRNVIEFLPEVKWQEAGTQEEEIKINTLEYNKALEQMILKSPTQWMWTHKRWKIDETVYD